MTFLEKCTKVVFTRLNITIFVTGWRRYCVQPQNWRKCYFSSANRADSGQHNFQLVYHLSLIWTWRWIHAEQKAREEGSFQVTTSCLWRIAKVFVQGNMILKWSRWQCDWNDNKFTVENKETRPVWCLKALFFHFKKHSVHHLSACTCRCKEKSTRLIDWIGCVFDWLCVSTSNLSLPHTVCISPQLLWTWMQHPLEYQGLSNVLLLAWPIEKSLSSYYYSLFRQSAFAEMEVKENETERTGG